MTDYLLVFLLFLIRAKPERSSGKNIRRKAPRFRSIATRSFRVVFANGKKFLREVPFSFGSFSFGEAKENELNNIKEKSYLFSIKNTFVKTRYWLVCLWGLTLQAQNYVDLVKIGYGQTLNNDFDASTSSTQVATFEADLTLPIVLNDDHVLVSGALFTENSLQLFPQSRFSNLYSTTLKLGLASTYNDTWSSTIVLLPKLASDYERITSDDLYIGGFALLKYKKNAHLTYRFGAYGSQEAFGFFATPIIGWYYHSPNERFEMDMSLPISADINYDLGSVTLGMDYYGIGRSFNITREGTTPVYVDLSSLEFATYLQVPTLNNTVLLRAKVGYASDDFEVYAQGEKIDLGLSAFSFGDDRTQLNPDISGGIFLKFEVLYRFRIPISKSEPENNK